MTDQRDFPLDLKEFISKCTWTYAKTMPEWPHEYIVRNRVDEDLFCQLARFIRQNGYDGKFYNREITYYDYDGMTYWTMGAPIEETTVINRCLKANTFAERQKEGRLPAK